MTLTERVAYDHPHAAALSPPTILSWHTPFQLAAATLACSLVVLGCRLVSPQFGHWFVFPVIMCGALIGADAIAVVQGRIGIMDPIGILGVLGLHFFFAAPLLHVLWNEWPTDLQAPADWRDWVGGMALLNALGLIIYRVLRQERKQGPVPRRSYTWELNSARAAGVFTVVLIVAGVLQTWVYSQFGGISGYIGAYLEAEAHYGEPSRWDGMGMLFTISECFPIIAMFAFVSYLRFTGKRPTWPALSLVLAIYFGLVILFGGLRGSRSTTVWALFWGVAILHYWIRRLTPTVLVLGISFFIFFMYVYGFYKAVGTDSLAALESSSHREQLSRQTGRTFHGTVLGDLARTDIQTYTLYRLATGADGYKYGFGRTYLGALSLLIPRSVWPGRPPTHIKEATELERGRGSFAPGERGGATSRVYGLAGEAMLNFGPIAAPLSFIVLGIVVRTVRRWMRTLAPNDIRWLLMPQLLILCFTVLVNDSDVNLFFVIKNGLVPFLVVVMASTRYSAANVVEVYR